MAGDVILPASFADWIGESIWWPGRFPALDAVSASRWIRWSSRRMTKRGADDEEGGDPSGRVADDEEEGRMMGEERLNLPAKPVDDEGRGAWPWLSLTPP